MAPMTGLPARLGRYEILGDLAVGGMAEILLARVVGPSGFERPVVIKRILPHLARQEGFVAMFLDEARIAAAVRHHNVIHVEELQQGDDGLYLVMEYLEGESAAGLMRRLFSRDETLDLGLASYLVAESCAGLHAAHEMTDAEGTVQHVVHRDVSPQNLFVTYDGQVKVLDFGVAKAADRITRTEVGQLKGKFEYMSPEQCSSRPIDRRSDIFALGIVLYELTTGRKLFKRNSPAETVRAICDHGILPPSRLLEDYPAALERICLRALEAAPEDRYPTALEMRRELLAFLRSRAASRELPHEPGEEMSRLMNAIFADRVAEKREILRRVRSGSKVTHVPAGEIDEGVEIAPAPEPTEVGGSATRTDVDVRAAVAPRSRWVAAVVGSAVVAASVALVAATFLHRPVASAAPATAVMTAAPSSAPLPPTAVPSASAAPPASPAPEPSTSTVAAAAPAAAPPARPRANPRGTAKAKDSAATGPWTKWH
jgi:serine/threonine protein kinase